MLRRMLRLLTVTLLVVFGSCAVVVSNPANAQDPVVQEPVAGIDYRILVVICDRYQGKFVDGGLPSPYRYGCVLIDGQIDCLETTECVFFRSNDERPPFEESCERGDGRYEVLDDTIFGCSNDKDRILLICPEQPCDMESEQPMP